jgi:DtxR family manganese transport transcriptional regulator
MCAAGTKASRPFRRTRHDHASETAEDYVEAIADTLERRGICRGADLAKLFGVSHVTVSKTVSRLRGEGLVETEPYGPLRLTSKGSQLAVKSRKRHETVMKFLMALGVSQSVAEIDSEGIEHHVSSETLSAFQRYIDRHTTPGS